MTPLRSFRIVEIVFGAYNTIRVTPTRLATKLPIIQDP
jgi:hypothetical protein